MGKGRVCRIPEMTEKEQNNIRAIFTGNWNVIIMYYTVNISPNSWNLASYHQTFFHWMLGFSSSPSVAQVPQSHDCGPSEGHSWQRPSLRHHLSQKRSPPIHSQFLPAKSIHYGIVNVHFLTHSCTVILSKYFNSYTHSTGLCLCCSLFAIS